MKKYSLYQSSIIFLLLFSFITCSFAQHPMAYERDTQFIKSHKIKSMVNYFYATKTDSILTSIKTFDTLGLLLTSKAFGRDGKITGVDSFMYDEKHYQVKQINHFRNKVNIQVTSRDFDDGKVVSSVLSSDSGIYYISNTYDAGGRLVKARMYTGSNDDTTTMQYFYNRKGLIKKSISFNNQQGTIVKENKHNASGKIIQVKQAGPAQRSFTELKYRANGDHYETTTTYDLNKLQRTDRIIYSHYHNGLTFEIIFFVNDKAISMEKTFYEYY